MPRHLTVEQRQLAFRLKARGLSLREIGPQAGCSHQGCRAGQSRDCLVAAEQNRAGWVETIHAPLPSAIACPPNRAVAAMRFPISRVIAASVIRIAMVGPLSTRRSGKPVPNQVPTIPASARPSKTSFNTMLYTVMTAPTALTQTATAFLSGEDPGAKQVVRGLLADLGWHQEWITDLGGIESARATEAAILFVPHVIRSSGFAPFAISIAR